MLGTFRTKPEHPTNRRYYLDPAGRLFQVNGRVKSCHDLTISMELSRVVTTPDGYTETYKFEFFFIDGVLVEVKFPW